MPEGQDKICHDERVSEMFNTGHEDMVDSEMETSDDLEKYKLLLEDSAREHSSLLIGNSSAAHASLMFSTMFRQAKAEISMVVGSFSGEVSQDPEYLSALESALKRNVKMRVLILDGSNPSSEALQLLTKYRDVNKKDILIGESNNDIKSILLEQMASDEFGNPIHFSIFDKSIYRLEIEPTRFSAVGCFNNIDSVNRLREVFGMVFSTATPC